MWDDWHGGLPGSDDPQSDHESFINFDFFSATTKPKVIVVNEYLAHRLLPLRSAFLVIVKLVRVLSWLGVGHFSLSMRFSGFCFVLGLLQDVGGGLRCNRWWYSSKLHSFGSGSWLCVLFTLSQFIVFPLSVLIWSSFQYSCLWVIISTGTWNWFTAEMASW